MSGTSSKLRFAKPTFCLPIRLYSGRILQGELQYEVQIDEVAFYLDAPGCLRTQVQRVSSPCTQEPA